MAPPGDAAEVRGPGEERRPKPTCVGIARGEMSVPKMAIATITEKITR